MTGDGCEVCRGPKAGSHICDECRDNTADTGDSGEMVDD